MSRLPSETAQLYKSNYFDRHENRNSEKEENDLKLIASIQIDFFSFGFQKRRENDK